MSLNAEQPRCASLSSHRDTELHPCKVCTLYPSSSRAARMSSEYIQSLELPTDREGIFAPTHDLRTSVSYIWSRSYQLTERLANAFRMRDPRLFHSTHPLQTDGAPLFASLRYDSTSYSRRTNDAVRSIRTSARLSRLFATATSIRRRSYPILRRFQGLKRVRRHGGKMERRDGHLFTCVPPRAPPSRHQLRLP